MVSEEFQQEQTLSFRLSIRFPVKAIEKNLLC
jgi:hypothetical protein